MRPHRFKDHSLFQSCHRGPGLFPQPYYSTRVNAGDIGSRVKQLDETTKQQLEGESEKNKAGFWEEFDVRFLPSSSYAECGVRIEEPARSRSPFAGGYSATLWRSCVMTPVEDWPNQRDVDFTHNIHYCRVIYHI